MLCSSFGWHAPSSFCRRSATKGRRNSLRAAVLRMVSHQEENSGARTSKGYAKREERAIPSKVFYAKQRRDGGKNGKSDSRQQKFTTNVPTKRFNQRLDGMAKSIRPNNKREGIEIVNRMEKLVFDTMKEWEDTVANLQDLSDVIRPETKTFNILINAFGRSAYPDSALRAEQILSNMFKMQETHGYPHLAPDSFSFTAVISALSRWANRSRKNAREAAVRAMQLLSRMESMAEGGNRHVAPTAVTFNTVLDVLSKTGNMQDAKRAEALVERMQQLYDDRRNANARPSVISYNACMKAYARCAANGAEDAPDRAEELLQHMKNTGINADRITYTTLIDCYAKAATTRPGAAVRAEEILRDMTHLYAVSGNDAIRPDYLSYSAVIGAWARTATPDAASRANSLLVQMEALHAAGADGGISLAPSTVTYNSVLNAFARSGHPDAAQQAWDLLIKMQTLSKLEDRNVKCDTITFSTVIDAIAKTRADPERAEELFFRMEKQYEDTGDESFRPNSISLSSAVNAWAKSDRPDAASRALSFLDKAERIAYLRPNAIVYSTLLECLAKSRSRSAAKAAEDVLVRMERLYREGKKEARPDAAAYANLINAYTKSGHPNTTRRAMDLLNEAERQYSNGNEAMKPTLLLYSAVLQALAKSATIEGAENAEALLRRKLYFRSRPKMTTVCFNAVIDAHARSGGPDAAEKAEAILNEMIRRFEQGDIEVKPSVRSFNAVCLAWKNTKNDAKAPKRAEAVLKKMNDMYRASGDTSYKPDICTINTIIGSWSNMGTKEAAEKAMAFLLYAEGRQAVGDETMFPDRITFRTCVEAWAKSGDETALKKAMEVAKRMEASPYKPDLYTLHSLMMAYNSVHNSGEPQPPWRSSSKARAAEKYLITLLAAHEAGRADSDLVFLAYDIIIRAYEKNGSEKATNRAGELRNLKDEFCDTLKKKDGYDAVDRNKWNLSRRFRKT